MVSYRRFLPTTYMTTYTPYEVICLTACKYFVLLALILLSSLVPWWMQNKEIQASARIKWVLLVNIASFTHCPTTAHMLRRALFLSKKKIWHGTGRRFYQSQVNTLQIVVLPSEAEQPVETRTWLALLTAEPCLLMLHFGGLLILQGNWCLSIWN